MSHTALITGATGLLGREVTKAFKQAGWLTVGQGFNRAKPPTILKANLEDPQEIRRLLDESKPQVVVHCAANRKPDSCEKNPEQARRINVEATRSLAEGTSSRGILLIYISTDYVFPGTEGEAPYEVDAPTNPPNVYGEMKRDGELAVLDITKTSGLGVVLRLPILYGPAESNSESAVNTILDAVDKASKNPDAGIKMDDWAQRYPTNTQDVGRVCNDVAVRYIKDKKHIQTLPKIIHFSAEEKMTKYEMAQRFAKILGVEIPGMIANKEGNDPNAAVKRPYDTHLSTKVLKEIGINVRAVGFDDWWSFYLKK